MIRRACLGLLLSLALSCTHVPRGEALVTVSDGRYAMGTVLEITLSARTEEAGRDLLERLFGLAAELDALLTVYDPESPLVAVNARAGMGPQPVPAELARILAHSVAYWRLTGGSFDVTVGPLVELWTGAARRDRPPSAAELVAARERVGSDKLRVSSGKPATVELEREGMSVNLGGVAKGYALDGMLELLAGAGVASAFVSFGQSSILAVGTPAGAAGWRVLLSDAVEGFAGVVTLRDRSLSVSSSFGQTTEIGGRRFGHVIDPRSGEALTLAMQAAVVAPSGALAEALSKALLILERDQALALLESQPEVEGLLIEADRSRWATTGWRRAVAFEPLEPASP